MGSSYLSPTYGYITNIYRALLLLVSIALVFTMSTAVHAQANTHIQFQGKIASNTNQLNLTSDNVSCINNSGADTCDFRINLYDSESDGILLFQEVHQNIEIGDGTGIFNIEINSVCESWAALGSPPSGCTGSPTVTGINWSLSPEVFIELEFDDDGNGDFVSSEIFTRKAYSYVPFALYADRAESINGLTSDNLVQTQPGSAQTVNATTTNALIAIDEIGSASPAFIQLQVGGTDQFIIDNNGNVSIGGGTDAFLDIRAATTSSAQINLSAGVDPTTPIAGDLWFDGTDFNFYDGSTTYALGTGSESSLFTDGSGVTYLTSETDNLVIGGSSIANSVFGIDVTLNDFYFGTSGTVDPEFVFENTSGTNGTFGFNSNNAFEFNNGGNNVKVGLNTSTPETELDINGDFEISGDILAAAASSSDLGTALKPFNNVYVSTVTASANPSITDSNVRIGGNILANSPTLASIGGGSTVVSTNNVGEWMDMKLNKDGNPVLAYRDITNLRLGVTVCGNPDCTSGNTTTFYSSSGNDAQYGISLAINVDNLPIISYYENAGQDHQIVRCSVPNCSSATLTAVDNGGAGQFSEIVIPTNGLPVMFSQHGPNDRLEARSCTTKDCSSFGSVVILDDTAADVGSWISAAVMSNGLPLVAYHDETNGNFKFARCLDQACLTATISNVYLDGPDVGEWARIILGIDNNPIIVFHEDTTGNILMFLCRNIACSKFERRLINPSQGFIIGNEEIGIATKIDGTPVLSYFNTTDGTFNIYECFDRYCNDGEEHKITNGPNAEGQYSNIARLPGTAETFVASYYDATDGDVELFTFEKTYSGGETLGDSTNYFSAVYTANLYSKSAEISNFDVAEEYMAEDPSLEPGDIVKFSDSENILGIVKSDGEYDDKVIGVISTEPGLYLKDWELENENSRPVALVGRVPVKVTDENGPIKRGDYIVSSSTPGYGMKATQQGTIVGRAMEDFNPSDLADADSVLVKQHLKEEKEAAFDLINEYESNIVSEILSESEIVEIEQKIEDLQIRAEELTKELDGLEDRDVSSGRIMMFVNLSEVGEQVFTNEINIYEAFESNEDLSDLSALSTFIDYSSESVSITAQEILLRGNVVIEGNLTIAGLLKAESAEFENLTTTGQLNFPESKKGTFAIPAGQVSTFVEYPDIKTGNKIFLTSSTSDVQIAVSEKKEGQGFEVKISNVLDSDIEVQYLIIN